jgi:uncharacterized protein YggT (Ycf19 family)
LIDPIAGVILLLRFLCFMAVFYLALYKLVVRSSRKPNNKLLWFFGVLTAPLTMPVRRYSSPDSNNNQIVSYALVFYALLWLVLIVAGRYWTK